MPGTGTVQGVTFGWAVLAVSALGWLLRSVIAACAALVIYVTGAAVLAKFKVVPEAEPGPEQVIAVEIRFRCVVCGTEVLMTSAREGSEIEAPRHCREDMVRVEEP